MKRAAAPMRTIASTVSATSRGSWTSSLGDTTGKDPTTYSTGSSPAADKRCSMTSWTVGYDQFTPAEEGLREALTSTGNGYVCARGTAEWEDVGQVHYPGTYTHGGFNRETTILGGRAVLNEDLVNLPNWLVLKLRIEDDEPVRLDSVEVLYYSHEYGIRTATVSRTLRWRDR